MNARLPELAPRQLRNAVTAALGVGIAAGLLWVLIWTERQVDPDTVNWPLFGVVTTLLLFCERTPRTWVRYGPIGVITPLWMFAYALLLVGAPALGVGAAVLGTTVHLLVVPHTPLQIVLRVCATSISLSTAALILLGMGVDGSITQFDSVPWRWGAAIVVAGVAIVVLNAVLAAVVMSVRRKISILTLVRRGLGIRLTAQGALVSLAPIWVIGIHFSPILAPLLAITTVLVFNATRKALEQAHEAYHDALTGLVNRRAFLEQLRDALTDTHPGTHQVVLLMDLNGFKEVNDRLGHQIGDALLVAFADRLSTSLVADAVAARLGGDEFAVVFTSNTAGDRLMSSIEGLHRELSEPLDVEGFPVSVGVSIGVAVSPIDGHTKTDLLRAADVAMYKAKRCATPIERYDNCVKVPQRGRLSLLSDLSDALDGHQLHIHFQPQLRMRDGSIDTVEALIRWHHPVHGSIPPSEFIGLAEQTDLIAPLTELVLRTATRGLVTDGSTDIKLAVNVSARSLLDETFAPRLLSILADTGFAPGRLELEVTERALVTNAERGSYTIDQLRTAGIRIAIDDFGAGYSSYQTLRTLEVDRVKIDRDFVAGVTSVHRDRLIVASLIDLAHQLGLDVVAEGVESAEVWDTLAALGCDVAQGYGIAQPMTFPDLRGWLNTWNEVLVEELAIST